MSIATLVVGIGGTGVSVVRALKKLWLTIDGPQRVDCSFLAFDFDRSALIFQDDGKPNGCPRRVNGEQTQDELKPAGSRFAELADDEFFYLFPKPIQDLLKNLDRGFEGKKAWENVLEWFPDRDKLPIPGGEVEANGASQLRPLGRLGFFLNDEVIESQIRRKLTCLQTDVDQNNLSVEKRVILVSSLAGGTGSGMLMDIAYVARRQDSHPKVFAYLLLPEVFQDVDCGDRIFPNTYACLQELAYLRNQQIPFNAKYYRIPPFDILPLTEEPFARIFLFGGDPLPGGEGIKAATVQMAKAIQAQLDKTIQEKTLAIVSNTLSSNPEDELKRRQTHSFSTASSFHIPLLRFENITGAVSKAINRIMVEDEYRKQIFGPNVSTVFQEIAQGQRGKLSGANGVNEVAPSQFSGDAIGLVKAWEKRLDDLCENKAKALIGRLKTLAGTLVDRAKSTPERLKAATADLEKIFNVVLAEYDIGRYNDNLKALRELQRQDEEPKAEPKAEGGKEQPVFLFDAEDKDAKDQVKSLVETIVNLGEQEKRVALSEISKELDRLWTSFGQPSSPALQQIRKDVADWKKDATAARDRARKNWFLKLFHSEIERLTSIQEISALSKLALSAIEDQVFQGHIQDIIRVRAANTLKEEVKKELKKVMDEVQPEALPWEEMAKQWRQEEDNAKANSVFKGPMFDFIRKEMDGIVKEIGSQRSEADTSPKAMKKLQEIVEKRIKNSDLKKYNLVLEQPVEEVEAKIRAALVRNRQSVFERRTPNPQHRGFTLVTLPANVLWHRDQGDLSSFIETSAMQILSCRCQTEKNGGSGIWIYHEDLFNPPDHIRNIDEYFRRYNNHPPTRELFHIDRRFLKEQDFRPINARISTATARCGNPGCTYDIAGLIPRETICPGCWNPIRSRCGNAACSENKLHERTEAKAKSCPQCGGYNRAAWWCCAKHGKVAVDVSTDKERCPQCIEDHLRDPVLYPASEISVRPDLLSRIYCPSCEDRAEKDASYDSYAIPASLVPFYRDGVNGHDRQEFLNLATKEGLPEKFRCPKCRACLIPIDHHSFVQSCKGSTQ